MKFELRDMYKYLISHTFPGLIFALDIIYAIKWSTKYDIYEIFKLIWGRGEAGNIIAFLILAYVLSTLFGIVLDGIHHLFFDDRKFFRFKFKEAEEELSKDKFWAINDKESQDIFESVLMEDYWYPSESYANIFIAMFVGFPLLIYWLHCLKSFDFLSFEFLVPFGLYTSIMVFMWLEALGTSKIFNAGEANFISVFSERNKKKAVRQELGQKGSN